MSVLELSEVKELLRKNPNDAYTLRAAGRYYLGDGHFKLAKDYFVQTAKFSLRLIPGLILEYEQKIAKNPQQLGSRLSLAAFNLSIGEIDPALLELEEILQSNPKNVEVYNALGKIYIKQERIDDVIVLLERSLAEGIRDVSLAEILAGAYLEKNRIRDAIKFYQEVLSHKPGHKQTLRILGELYTRIEEYFRAAKCG